MWGCLTTSTYIFFHHIHIFFMTSRLICGIWEITASGPFMFNSLVKSKNLALTCSAYGIEKWELFPTYSYIVFHHLSFLFFQEWNLGLLKNFLNDHKPLYVLQSVQHFKKCPTFNMTFRITETNKCYVSKKIQFRVFKKMLIMRDYLLI